MFGYTYFLVAVYQPPPEGDNTFEAWPYVRMLRSKTQEEVLKAVQEIVASIEATHVARAVYRIHSDRGGEFVNHSLKKWAAERTIALTTTEGHDPAQKTGKQKA